VCHSDRFAGNRAFKIRVIGTKTGQKAKTKKKMRHGAANLKINLSILFDQKTGHFCLRKNWFDWTNQLYDAP